MAAASVIAKVARDRLMEEMDLLYPGYDLARNKGYAAPEHRAGLDALGLTPIHRLSFAPCRNREQMSLWDDAAADADADADAGADADTGASVGADAIGEEADTIGDQADEAVLIEEAGLVD